jgi:hypothetical protein
LPFNSHGAAGASGDIDRVAQDRLVFTRQWPHSRTEGGDNMLIRFSSVETGSITMFGDVALQLIHALGVSNAIPGAIRAQDIPAAVRHLREELRTHASPGGVSVTDGHDGNDREPEIALETRAVPLIDLLERASAANVPVMWEPT